jgi:phage tail tape-measure protein
VSGATTTGHVRDERCATREAARRASVRDLVVVVPSADLRSARGGRPCSVRIVTATARAATLFDMSLGRLLGRAARTPAVIVGVASVSLRVAREARRHHRGEITREELHRRSGGHLGGVVGATAGAAAGSVLGSVVPVVGTALGGLAGGLLGEHGGQKLGVRVVEGVRAAWPRGDR